MKVFGDYSKYYDLLYAGKEYEKEATFVDSLLKQYSQKPVRTLLELGSGTGKHAYCLAKKGYSLHGIDQSSDMLEMAGTMLLNAEPHLKSQMIFEKADIRDLRLKKQFDAAISLFHVMSYQTTNSDLERAFMTVKEHVAPGGVFLFDCWYGPAALTQLPEVRHRRFENEHGIVERVAVPTLNENENTIEVHYHLYVQEKNAATYYKLEEHHLMRYLFLPEIQNLCAKFGMKLVQSCEWLTHQPLSRHTWGACFVVTV